MKTWLKVVAIVLLFYAVLSSFYHPLAPGGLSIDIDKLTPGENTFEFTGYNTHFTNSDLQVYMRSGENTFFCGTILEVKDKSHVKVSLALPDTLPSNDLVFYANNSEDGTVLVLKSLDLNAFVFQEGYKPMSSCKIQVVTEEHQHFGYPFQIILYETIRNLMWHVPMWFTMFVLMFISFGQSLRTLNALGREREDNLDTPIDFAKVALHDLKASTSAHVGLLFCILGLVTGSIWAKFTWLSWWVDDPQLNGAMVVFLMYVSYFILRNSVNDLEKRARLAAIFNIFAFVLLVVLLMVMPRFADSLHPGKSGNPAFSSYDLDSSLRMVFYPAVLGFILLGYWMYSSLLRVKKLEQKYDEHL